LTKQQKHLGGAFLQIGGSLKLYLDSVRIVFCCSENCPFLKLGHPVWANPRARLLPTQLQRNDCWVKELKHGTRGSQTWQNPPFRSIEIDHFPIKNLREKDLPLPWLVGQSGFVVIHRRINPVSGQKAVKRDGAHP
jgi:hypothetical protein